VAFSAPVAARCPAESRKDFNVNLPGYDAWKLDDPYYISPTEEAALIERDRDQQDNLRDQIAAVLQDHLGGIYLADVRRIVVEELNKLRPGAGEPAWQTATPVSLPR
jgi:hypothetical protein